LNFTDLGLRAALLRSVREQVHVVPTPVQARAIPAILSGRDVTQIARAGTGKTAAYALPLLQRLMGARGGTARAVRAMVLVESRDVALHVAGELLRYGAYLPFRCSASFGGQDPKPRHLPLRSVVDIVVGSPASILADLHRRELDLQSVEILVLDDVDRILERHSHQVIRQFLSYLPSSRQNVLFSASPSDDLELVLGFVGYESLCAVDPRSGPQQRGLPRRVRASAVVGRVAGRPNRAVG
jgi:ATP-dependent RNA helicase RhlE